MSGGDLAVCGAALIGVVLAIRRASQRKRSIQEIAEGLGLRVIGHRVTGRFAGVPVEIDTRGRATESEAGDLTILAALPDWPDGFSAQPPGVFDDEFVCPKKFQELARERPLSAELSRVLSHRTEIRNGVLVWCRQGSTLDESDARKCLGAITTWATRLDHARGAAQRSIEERRARWLAEFAALGLRREGEDRASGCYRGVDLELERVGEGTRIRASLGPDLPPGLQISHQKALQRLMIKQDFQLEDERVDRVLRISTDDVPRSERLLRKREIHEPICALFEAQPGARIEAESCRSTSPAGCRQSPRSRVGSTRSGVSSIRSSD